VENDFIQIIKEEVEVQTQRIIKFIEDSVIRDYCGAIVSIFDNFLITLDKDSAKRLDIILRDTLFRKALWATFDTLERYAPKTFKEIRYTH